MHSFLQNQEFLALYSFALYSIDFLWHTCASKKNTKTSPLLNSGKLGNPVLAGKRKEKN